MRSIELWLSTRAFLRRDWRNLIYYKALGCSKQDLHRYELAHCFWGTQAQQRSVLRAENCCADKMEQRQITGLTRRPELNGAVVEILGRDASTGRLRVRVVGQPQLGAMALKRENLTELSWSNTAKQAFGRLDVNELRQNARFFWSKPAAKVVLVVLALAIANSVEHRYRRSAAFTAAADAVGARARVLRAGLRRRAQEARIRVVDRRERCRARRPRRGHARGPPARSAGPPRPVGTAVGDRSQGGRAGGGGFVSCMLYKQVIYTQRLPPPRAGRQAPASPPPVRAAR